MDRYDDYMQRVSDAIDSIDKMNYGIANAGLCKLLIILENNKSPDVKKTEDAELLVKNIKKDDNSPCEASASFFKNRGEAIANGHCPTCGYHIFPENGVWKCKKCKDSNCN